MLLLSLTHTSTSTECTKFRYVLKEMSIDIVKFPGNRVGLHDPTPIWNIEADLVTRQATEKKLVKIDQ